MSRFDNMKDGELRDFGPALDNPAQDQLDARHTEILAEAASTYKGADALVVAQVRYAATDPNGDNPTVELTASGTNREMLAVAASVISMLAAGAREKGHDNVANIWTEMSNSLNRMASFDVVSAGHKKDMN